MRYFEPDGAPFRLTMGLRRLDPAEWIEVDEDYAADIALKQRLLATRYEEVAASLPEGESAAAEAGHLLLRHLNQRFPHLLAAGDPAAGGLSGAPPGGADPSGDVESPLVEASRLVQEDLCVMHRRPDAWVLAAAIVCFPSRWSLREKLGADLDAIHTPVPGYADRIAAPTHRFFDRLTAERPMWRLNWTILDDPALFQPTGARLPAHTAPADLTVRVERQTLRRLPRTQDVLFTIRTYRGRLADVLAPRPAAAADLAATLRTVGTDYAAYRGWTDMLDGLLDWLAGFPAGQDGTDIARPGGPGGSDGR